MAITVHSASTKRLVADVSLFASTDETLWETAYKLVFDPKYAKNTRKFSRDIVGKTHENGDAPIYLIPRQRGGPGYLSVPLVGVEPGCIQYCPISKGFGMQDVSSFTLGPIVGEGLCLVNAAFSKSICVAHIEGGGIVDLRRKNFWKRAKKPLRTIHVVDNTTMLVDGELHNIFTWLIKNEALWFPQWDTWRKHVALCGRGDFHWTDVLGDTLCYRKGTQYLNFIQWKKECYIRPSYELLPDTDVYKFLEQLHFTHKIPIGLVHPKAVTGAPEYPITFDYIRDLYNSPYEMCCQPFVVAGLLMKVPIE